jgi:hypothetical protein
MQCLGQGPDRRAPTTKMSSRTTHFRGSESCVQRWSRTELGLLVSALFSGERGGGAGEGRQTAVLMQGPSGASMYFSLFGGPFCIFVGPRSGPFCCMRTCPVSQPYE